MMESIEKLRTFARNMAKGSYLVNHEECNLLLIIADEIECEIAEKYMELPVDADGVPIRVGDVMCSAGIREKGHKVIVSAIFEDGFVEYGSDNGLIGPLCQEDWVHVTPRTIEDVLHDFWEEWESHPIDAEWGVRLERLRESEAKYAAEIRELMEVDE